MNEQRHVRRAVARAYAHAVCRPAAVTGCRPVPKGTLIKIAGYTRAELEGLPADAVVNSFGCGNPLAFSDVKEGDVVLDLGCGAGIDILLAAKKTGPAGRAIGVDMTDEMLARARANIAASGLTNAEVRRGTIEDLPVDSASVDWVISNCVINLSAEKHRVFVEIARVLRPAGCVLVSDVVAEDLPERVRNDLARCHCCVAGALSEEEYRDGLRRVGLVDVEIRARTEYNAAQLEQLVESDMRAYEVGAACCGGSCGPPRSMKALATACAGKVWSARIFARRPA